MTTFLEALANEHSAEAPRLEDLPIHHLHRRVNAIVGDIPVDGQILRLFYHDRTGRVECSFAGYYPIPIATEEWLVVSYGMGARASVDKNLSFLVGQESGVDDGEAVVEGWSLEDAKTGRVLLCSLFDNGRITLHAGDSLRVGELPVVVSW